jgi:hypothetical protein
MLQFNANDPGDTPYKLQRALKESGLSRQQVCDRLKSDYGVELTLSAVSHIFTRGTLSLQRALQNGWWVSRELGAIHSFFQPA